MSSSESRGPRIRAMLVALAVTAAAAVSAAPATAAPAEGSAKIRLATQQKGNGLVASGVRIRPASLPVVDLELREAATVRTRGALKLSLDGRRARLRSLILQVSGGNTAISAKLGKRRLVVFRASGQSEAEGLSVKLNKAALSLTGKAARALRPRLGLDSLAAGSVGTLSLDAHLSAAETPAPKQPKKPDPKGPDPVVDPYFAQCALNVTGEEEGDAAGPAPAPTLSGPAAVTGGKVEWGFQKSFREYVFFSGGSLAPIAPAEVLNAPLPAPQTGSFRYPAESGEYAINDSADDGDDQAVVNGEGEIVLCNAPHGFRVTLSNPTVTIDGDESRLTVDVDTNMSGVHTPTQRVDLAALDIDGADPFYNEDAKMVTWSNLPVTLTEAGAEALQLCNPMVPGPCSYEEGGSLEPLSFTASMATVTAWPFVSACNIAIPSAASSWPTAPSAPAAAPELTNPEGVSEGSISWGFRNGLRTTVQTAPGVFNLSGGATRSDPSDMSGAGKYFTWPASAGEYEAGTPGRLVLRGGGTVGLCNTAHGFGTVLANPTLTIDGAKSRLTMDVASRFGASWTSGRVDLASLAIGSVVVEELEDTPSAGMETIKWTFPDPGDDDTDSSVTLTEAGSRALWLLGNTYRTLPVSLNKLSVSIVREAD